MVRKAAGIEFAGWDPTTSWLIAEVEMEQEPPFGLRPGGGIGRVADGGRAVGGSIGVVLTEPQLEHTGPPTLQDLSEALIAADGTDYGVHSPTWISRFNDMTRQAVSYREGRVLLAGDAAHIHAPPGGQGLNIGVQDAVNLGWKLAQVLRGVSPESFLDTYGAERHPVGARVLQSTMAQIALRRTDARTEALQGTITELLGMDEPRRRFGGMLSGLDVHYDLGRGASAARPAHARYRPGHRRRTGTGVRVAAHGAAGAPQPQRTRRLRPVAMGGPAPNGRCRARRRVGTPRPR